MTANRVLRSVLATGRIPGRTGRAVHAAVAGAWLARLTTAELVALDEAFYDLDALYRTDAWNERGLFGWERAAIASFDPGSRIVVPGCGGGREVLALLRAGFDAVGYEPHRDLAGYAERFLAAHEHPNRAHPAPRDAFPPGATPDGVLVGWGAYSLIAGSRARIAFLAAARTALRPGGAIIVSGFHHERHRPVDRLAVAIANRGRARRALEPVELGDTLAPNRVHVFTTAELAAELGAAGLRQAAVERVDEPVAGYAYAIGRAP